MNNHNTDEMLRSILPYSYIVGQEHLKLALDQWRAWDCKVDDGSCLRSDDV